MDAIRKILESPDNIEDMFDDDFDDQNLITKLYKMG